MNLPIKGNLQPFPSEQSVLPNQGESVAQRQQNPQTEQDYTTKSVLSEDNQERTKGYQTSGTQMDENGEINRKLSEYTRQPASFTWWLFIATLALAAIVFFQVLGVIYIAIQQLRAYVVVVTASIGNVAVPPANQPKAGSQPQDYHEAWHEVNNH